MDTPTTTNWYNSDKATIALLDSAFSCAEPSLDPLQNGLKGIDFKQVKYTHEQKARIYLIRAWAAFCQYSATDHYYKKGQEMHGRCIVNLEKSTNLYSDEAALRNVVHTHFWIKKTTNHIDTFNPETVTEPTDRRLIPTQIIEGYSYIKNESYAHKLDELNKFANQAPESD